MVTAAELDSARATIAEGKVIRQEIERESILAGAWERDVVDRIVNDHGERLKVEDGRVSGVKAALDAYRKKNPEGFCKLGPIASNEKLPAMTRFAAAYSDIVKTQDRKKSFSTAVNRGLSRVRKGGAS
jgi:hypothetical protein